MPMLTMSRPAPPGLPSPASSRRRDPSVPRPGASVDWAALLAVQAQRGGHVRRRQRLDERPGGAGAGLPDAQDVLLIGAHQDRDGAGVALADQAGHLDAAETREVD